MGMQSYDLTLRLALDIVGGALRSCMVSGDRHQECIANLGHGSMQLHPDVKAAADDILNIRNESSYSLGVL